MKNKISFILAILITLCAFNTKVNAEELFRNEFTTEKGNIGELNISELEIPNIEIDLNKLPDYIKVFLSDSVNNFSTNYAGPRYLNKIALGTTATVPVPFNEGYIKIDMEDDGTNLLYINAYGETIKSNKINDEYILSGGMIRYFHDLTIEYGGKFYCLGINKNNKRISTLVLNENLEVEKRLENQIMLGIIDDRFYFVGDGGFSTTDASLHKFNNFDVIGILPRTIPNDSQIDILGKQIRYLIRLLPRYEWLADICYDDVLNIAKLYLGVYSKIYPAMTGEKEYTEEEQKQIQEEIYEVQDKSEEIFNNNKIVKFVLHSDFEGLDISSNYLLIIDGDHARVMDKSGNQVANLEVGYDDVYSVQLIHDYIAVFRYSEEELITRIDMYDFNGNKIQTVSSKENELLLYAKENQGGFAVASADLKTMKKSRSKQTSVALFTNMLEESDESLPSFLKESSVRYTSSVYSMPQAVALNVLGSGNVTVANNARFGERVTLNVDIPEGQMLKKVRVYDANGKEIVVENNTFLMPNTPVTIDAEFVPVLKENPKTGIISLTFLGIASVGLYLTYRKNKANLTKFKRI